ncbi:MAG: hypothetical protein O7D32_04360 [bacterium]|nr:hypothetical protein [bacterium]
MRKIVWLMIGAMVWIAGCTERETVTPVATPPGKVADITEVGNNGFVVEYYAPENSHTARTLEAFAENLQGKAGVEFFVDKGYEVRPEHAFVLEGRFSDGELEGMAILPMTRPDTEDVEAVYIFHLWRDGRTYTVPARFAIIDDDGPIYDRRNLLRFAENVILQLLRPLDVPGPDTAAAIFSWRQWARCSGTAAAVVSCALTCRFLPGAQLHCFTICAGARTVGAMIGCLVTQR